MIWRGRGWGHCACRAQQIWRAFRLRKVTSSGCKNPVDAAWFRTSSFGALRLAGADVVTTGIVRRVCAWWQWSEFELFQRDVQRWQSMRVKFVPFGELGGEFGA